MPVGLYVCPRLMIVWFCVCMYVCVCVYIYIYVCVYVCVCVCVELRSARDRVTIRLANYCFICGLPKVKYIII